jgi:hypothetical protein
MAQPPTGGVLVVDPPAGVFGNTTFVASVSGFACVDACTIVGSYACVYVYACVCVYVCMLVCVSVRADMWVRQVQSTAGVEPIVCVFYHAAWRE